MHYKKMDTTDIKQNKTNNPFYNICIVDNSIIYALGLKKSIEKSLHKKAESLIFHYKEFNDITDSNVDPIDIIFIDYNDMFLPNFHSFFLKLKKNNPKLKLIVSSVELLNIDFIKLYSYNINGLFSKSLSIKAFNIYFKRVLTHSTYIDNYSIVRAIEQERKQKIRFYYKSISLQNLDFIQSQYMHFVPYLADKSVLTYQEMNNRN